jgi:hypothetical protein
VNSIQILAWIASAQNNTGDSNGVLEDAYLELTNSTNQAWWLNLLFNVDGIAVQHEYDQRQD